MKGGVVTCVITRIIAISVSDPVVGKGWSGNALSLTGGAVSKLWSSLL